MWTLKDDSTSSSIQDQEQDRVWQSKRRKDPETIMQIDAAHRALYERVESSISSGFASAQRALVDLQLQLQIKLRQLREQQEMILQTQSPSSDAVAEFEDNVRKIDRSLESFTAHADNLSHIKLTLARAAAFVSPEGNLAQLVTKAQPKQRGNLLWQQDSIQPPLSINYSGETQSQASYTGSTSLTASAPAYQPRAASRGSLGGSTDLMRSLDSGSALGPSILNSQSQAFRPERNLERLERSLERNLERNLDRSLERNLERSLGPDSGLGLDRLHLSNSSNRIPNSTCFVFYLPPSATNETLRQLFMRYGTVLNAYVAMDKVTNRTRGFGFVDFSTPSEAQAAVAGLDKYPLEGKFLSVSIKV